MQQMILVYQTPMFMLLQMDVMLTQNLDNGFIDRVGRIILDKIQIQNSQLLLGVIMPWTEIDAGSVLQLAYDALVHGVRYIIHKMPQNRQFNLVMIDDITDEFIKPINHGTDNRKPTLLTTIKEDDVVIFLQL